MTFVFVRVSSGDVPRVSAQIGAEGLYHDAPESVVLWRHYPSKEEAVRASALAVLAGYEAWIASVPP